MSFLTSRTRTAPEGLGRPVRRVEDELGVEHVEVPLTPERVLAAIRAARRPG